MGRRFLTGILLVTFVALLVAGVVAQPFFSEVYADPPGSDNNREFVELCGLGENGTALNLSGFRFADSASGDTLSLSRWNGSSPCALLVEDGFDASGLSCSIYRLGASIGNGLNNGGDALRLFAPNGSLLLTSSYGATETGRSLVWNGSGWLQATPSPCIPTPINNSIFNDITNSTENNVTNSTINCTIDNCNNINNNISNNSMNESNTSFPFSLTLLLPTTLYTGVPYENPFRIRNNAYESGGNATNLTLTLTLCHASECTTEQHALLIKSWKSSGTGILLLNKSGNYTLCAHLSLNSSEKRTKKATKNSRTSTNYCWNLTARDPHATPCNISLALAVENEQPYYTPGETLRFRNLLSNDTFPYSITYRVESFDGATLRSTRTENQHTKRWTPPKRSGIRLYWLENSLLFLACNNSNNHTSNRHLIVVVGKGEKERSENARITLAVPAKTYRAGDTIPVTLSITKGTTRKYSIKLWTEQDGRRSSATTTIHVSDDVELQVPLLLKANAKSGTHTLHAEGLDTSATTRITVEDSAAPPAPQRARITSFYTRNRKAQQRITLAARVVGNGTLTLYGLNDYDKTASKSGTWKRTVHLRPGKNPFLLLLSDEDGVLDAATLLLVMNATSITRVDHYTSEPEIKATLLRMGEKHATAGEKNGTSAKESGKTALFTGYATKENNTRRAPLLLGLAGALALAIVLREK